MEKVPFDIKEIRVSESSMGGYGLDVFLKSGLQMKSKFESELQYQEAVAAKGNLTLLKEIFRDWINSVLEQNPKYFYVYSNCELFDVNFGHILEEPGDGFESMLKESMELIHSCAVEKGIEFDGYFTQRWKDAADTVVSFDEEYFDDPDKRDLYVYLSAMVDDEIFGFLDSVYRTFEYTGFDRPPLTKEILEEKIHYLTKEKGVRF